MFSLRSESFWELQSFLLRDTGAFSSGVEAHTELLTLKNLLVNKFNMRSFKYVALDSHISLEFVGKNFSVINVRTLKVHRQGGLMWHMHIKLHEIPLTE